MAMKLLVEQEQMRPVAGVSTAAALLACGRLEHLVGCLLGETSPVPAAAAAAAVDGHE
jgi:hypothetical protein